MEPFQSGVWGRGRGGIILIPEVGVCAPPPVKVVVICVYFK